LRTTRQRPNAVMSRSIRSKETALRAAVRVCT
jgi:hypothetical protein